MNINIQRRTENFCAASRYLQPTIGDGSACLGESLAEGLERDESAPESFGFAESLAFPSDIPAEEECRVADSPFSRMIGSAPGDWPGLVYAIHESDAGHVHYSTIAKRSPNT